MLYLLLIPLAVSVGFFMLRKYRRKSDLQMQASVSKSNPYGSDNQDSIYEEKNLHNKQSSSEEQINKDGNMEKSDLQTFVSEVIREKGNLKPEEKEILLYISEKEGAAFEGEIRSKFILPKTSLWRLIKRLERENLIEVTKIGGQNLIKLKLSHK
jgi:hypothetical protein